MKISQNHGGKLKGDDRDETRTQRHISACLVFTSIALAMVDGIRGTIVNGDAIDSWLAYVKQRHQLCCQSWVGGGWIPYGQPYRVL